MSADLERRFGGVARLYGQEGAAALRKAGAMGMQSDGRPSKKQRRQILGLRG